jgi:hypothetical protein
VPLMTYLQREIFAPLHMDHVTEDDTHPLSASDAAGYTRQGLGPARPAKKEGAGWLFGASKLAMTPGELASRDVRREAGSYICYFVVVRSFWLFAIGVDWVEERRVSQFIWFVWIWNRYKCEVVEEITEASGGLIHLTRGPI